MNRIRLFRLLWLSIVAAVATISLKTAAYLLTGSVGLLSDAAESVVNLVAAVGALLALRWASVTHLPRRPDLDPRVRIQTQGQASLNRSQGFA